MKLGELLDGGGGDEVAVHVGDRVTTRGELRALAEGLAERLPAGQLVGVRLPNGPEAIAAWFAAWRSGGAFAPLNPRSPEAEVAKAVDRTGASVVVSLDAAGGYRVEEQPGVEPRPLAGDEAIVQFTSGTTGEPKAVVLHHGRVLDQLDDVISTLRGGRAERPTMPNLVPLSLATWGGIYQVLFAFRLGVPVVLMERFEPAAFAELVRAHGIKSSVLPPAALVMLLEDPSVDSLAPLRYVRSVGAPLSPAHARRFAERFGVGILNGYGQTELGGEAVGWSAEDWKRFGDEKLGSVGRPHATFEVRVRPLDDGAPGEGGVGELEIRSTAAPPPDDPALAGRVTDDGWLRTGDLGRVDEDGFVWVEGRVSAMINRGGLKVFPDEVEEVLRRHPDVLDAAVAGRPDDRLGEVPWAWVVPAGPTAPGDEALAGWCREHLAPYKVPVGFSEVVSLPRNEMGKVVRKDLVDAS